MEDFTTIVPLETENITDMFSSITPLPNINGTEKDKNNSTLIPFFTNSYADTNSIASVETGIWILTTQAPSNDTAFLIPLITLSPDVERDVRSTWEAVICGVFLCLMLLLAAAGNIAVNYAVFRFEKLREQVS